MHLWSLQTRQGLPSKCCSILAKTPKCLSRQTSVHTIWRDLGRQGERWWLIGCSIWAIVDSAIGYNQAAGTGLIHGDGDASIDKLCRIYWKREASVASCHGAAVGAILRWKNHLDWTQHQHWDLCKNAACPSTRETSQQCCDHTSWTAGKTQISGKRQYAVATPWKRKIQAKLAWCDKPTCIYCKKLQLGKT